MSAVRGTIKSYDRQTGEWVIVLDGDEEEEVLVDSDGSRGAALSVGSRVELQRIHRPNGVYASSVELIE